MEAILNESFPVWDIYTCIGSRSSHFAVLGILQAGAHSVLFREKLLRRLKWWLELCRWGCCAFLFCLLAAHPKPRWIIVSSDSSTQYQNHLKIKGTNEQPRCVFVCVKIQPQRSYSILWVCLNIIVPAPSCRWWFGLLCLFFCSTHVWGRRLAVSASLRWFSGYFQLCTCSVSRSIHVDRAVVAVPLVPLPAPFPCHTPRLLTSVLQRRRQSHFQYSISCAFWTLLSRFIYLFIFI